MNCPRKAKVWALKWIKHLWNNSYVTWQHELLSWPLFYLKCRINVSVHLTWWEFKSDLHILFRSLSVRSFFFFYDIDTIGRCLWMCAQVCRFVIGRLLVWSFVVSGVLTDRRWEHQGTAEHLSGHAHQSQLILYWLSCDSRLVFLTQKTCTNHKGDQGLNNKVQSTSVSIVSSYFLGLWCQGERHSLESRFLQFIVVKQLYCNQVNRKSNKRGLPINWWDLRPVSDKSAT